MVIKANEQLTSALETRILSQKNQHTDLNKWIFSNLKVNPEDDVLELCCGIGAQTEYFSRKIKFGSLDCVDVNPESIEKIKTSISNEKIDFFVSEIDDTDNYANNIYDIIFCAYGFYYSKSPELLHAKLKGCLKENGRFVIVGPTLGNNVPLYNIVENIGCEIPDDIIDVSEKIMLRFLAMFLKNYKDVKTKRIINRIEYSSHEQLLEYWRNTTFYCPGKDKEFLKASEKMFPGKIFVDKSIGYLEGMRRIEVLEADVKLDA
jgi:ubiquinone/menaquinone biosynthesis C-methylase UbiE